MTEYIQTIIPNAPIIPTITESKIDFIEKLIKDKFNFSSKPLENFYSVFIQNNISDNKISFELFIKCIENDIIDEDFMVEFNDKKHNLLELQKLLSDKFNNIELKIRLNKLTKVLEELIEVKITNYSDETIYNFVKTLITIFNLECELNDNEDPIDYLLRIDKNYTGSKIKKSKLIKLIKNKYLSKYYSNILFIHSLHRLNLLNFEKKEIEEFIYFMNNLYFDRDDGYEVIPIEMKKISKTSNLDLYQYFQNTPKQVNLICFIEEQRTPNPKLRSNLDLINKLFRYGKLFCYLGYNVIVICSEFVIEDKIGYWKNTPINIREINDFDLLIKKYSVNCLNIYLDVEFECL